MSDEIGFTEIGLGSLIVVVVAALVVAVAALGGTVLGGATTPTFSADTDAPTDGPAAEYAPENVIVDPVPARGSVAIDGSLRAGDDPKRVVIEWGDRIETEDLRQLVRALTLAGHEIAFRPEGSLTEEPLMEELEDADAYVRIDPAEPLTREELRTVQNFTDQGGHVVTLAEPNRIEVSISGFGTSIETVRTDTVPLAAQYDVVFGNRYLYNTRTNDGNFKNVFAEPTSAGEASLGRTVLYTATRVSVREDARDTEVLARALPSTNLSDGGSARAYPVVVRSGEFLAVGDTTFMRESRHNVAANERLIGFVATFAVSSDRPADATLQPEEDDEGEEESGEDGPDGNGT